MTTPQEALRALRWGADLLQQMGSDPSVPKALADGADRIASTYPVPEAIDDHVRDAGKPFPSDWIDAFVSAWYLFEDLLYAGNGSEKTRRDLRFTLRHYPEVGTLQALASRPTGFSWLPGPGDPLDK